MTEESPQKQRIRIYCHTNIYTRKKNLCFQFQASLPIMRFRGICCFNLQGKKQVLSKRLLITYQTINKVL